MLSRSYVAAVVLVAGFTGCAPRVRPLAGTPAPARLPLAELPAGRQRIDFRWEYRNAAAIEITGFSAENREGRTLLELLPGNATNGMLEVYRNIVETAHEP